MMALEEQFEITLDEEGAYSRQAQLLSQQGAPVSRVLTPALRQARRRSPPSRRRLTSSRAR